MTGEVIRSYSGPVASSTIVGWVLSGRVGVGSSNTYCLETHLLRSVVGQPEKIVEGNDLREELQKCWNVKNIEPIQSKVADKFKDDIVYSGMRYVVRLPFKPDHDILPDNYQVSIGRLQSLKTQLVSKGILDDYNLIFQDYEKNGIIECLKKSLPRKQAKSTTFHTGQLFAKTKKQQK